MRYYLIYCYLRQKSLCIKRDSFSLERCFFLVVVLTQEEGVAERLRMWRIFCMEIRQSPIQFFDWLSIWFDRYLIYRVNLPNFIQVVFDGDSWEVWLCGGKCMMLSAWDYSRIHGVVTGCIVSNIHSKANRSGIPGSFGLAVGFGAAS